MSSTTFRYLRQCGQCSVLVLGSFGLGLAQPASRSPMASTALRFNDATREAGITFRHNAGGSGRYFYIEQLGGGAAFLDYDNDGWLDLFLAQGAALRGYQGAEISGNVLYRNNRDGTFVDVTRAVALPVTGYTFGIAAADYDGDGDTDVLVTTADGSRLLRNDRGRFADVTAAAGVRSGQLSTGASFFDYDGDGRLDLFVARYGTYSVESDDGCSEFSAQASAYRPGMARPQADTRKMTCSPKDIEPISNQLFRNNGNGSFTDVTGSSGIGQAVNHGFGVAIGDYDEDGRSDVFVASDLLPNLLFINRGNGTFEERGLASGVAVGAQGTALAGMGADAGDYDNDGHLDLFITNFENETSSLYRGAGDGSFTDQSQRSGVTAATLPFLKWGSRFVDLDLDGWQDLLIVNGHVSERVPSYPVQMEHLQKGRGHAQRAQILANTGTGRFVEVSMNAGPYFLERRVSRGAAFADYDNDGDTDVLITNNNQPPVLLRNDTPAARRWARLVLQGTRFNREAIGAIVRVTSGGVTQTQTIKSGGSYLSDHDRRLLFGLPGTDPARAQIRWPCGAPQIVTLAPNRTTTVRDPGCRQPQSRPEK